MSEFDLQSRQLSELSKNESDVQEQAQPVQVTPEAPVAMGTAPVESKTPEAASTPQETTQPSKEDMNKFLDSFRKILDQNMESMTIESTKPYTGVQSFKLSLDRKKLHLSWSEAIDRFKYECNFDEEKYTMNNEVVDLAIVDDIIPKITIIQEALGKNAAKVNFKRRV